MVAVRPAAPQGFAPMHGRGGRLRPAEPAGDIIETGQLPHAPCLGSARYNQCRKSSEWLRYQAIVRSSASSISYWGVQPRWVRTFVELGARTPMSVKVWGVVM